MDITKQFNKRILLLASILILPLTFLVQSCNSTDSGSEVEFEDGISLDIRELLGEELLNVIENELQMPIHRGDDPPDIVAQLSEIEAAQSLGKGSAITNETGVTILMEPMLLLNTNVPEDEGVIEPGNQFLDNFIRFSNQDREKFTIDFDRVDRGLTPFFGAGSFIIGNGNRFTIFGPQESEADEDSIVLTTNIFSGIITEEGISQPHYTIVMVDNAGMDDSLIPNDTGRSFEDGNGFAPLDNWPAGDQPASFNNLNAAVEIISQK